MPNYTYVNLQTRVADEINDSSAGSVSTAQVKKAIISAIEYYEGQRNWFGEAITRSGVTVAGFPAVAMPSDAVFLDKMQLSAVTSITATTNTNTLLTACSNTVFSVGQFLIGTGIPDSTLIKSIDSSSQITMGDVTGASVNATSSTVGATIRVVQAPRYDIEPISYQQYSGYQGQTGSTGQPSQYCYYQDRLYLYPTPGSVYALMFWYIKRLPALSADGDTNGWTNFAEPVIRNRAKWDIFLNLLRNMKLAQAAKAQETDAMDALETEHVQRNTTGRLRARYL